VRSLIEGAGGDWAMFAQWVCMLLMTAGLALMPAAMLHGVVRLWRTGFEAPARPNYWCLLLYLPLCLLAPASRLLSADPAAA
jgi:hypothetical protein